MSQYKLPEGWENWPVKQVTIAGKQHNVRYDEKNSYAYLLDDKGNWTGKTANASRKAITADTDTGEEADDSENEGEQTEDQQPPKKKKITLHNTRKSKTNPILIIIIAILAGLLLFKNTSSGPSETTFEVIVAMENIQPGQPVEGKLSAITISAEEYRAYTVNGGIYHADQYDGIRSFIATDFIQKDSLITYTNVGRNFSAKNPWIMNIGTDAVIIIPVTDAGTNLSKYICGNVIDLTVTVETIMKTDDCLDAERPDIPEASSSSSQKIVQVDTYTIRNLVIVDVLNKGQESLYSTHAALAAIPEEHRAETLASRYNIASKVNKDTPAYVTLRVSKECKDWWQTITGKYDSEISVKISFTTNINCTNDAQTKAYSAISSMMPTLADTWNNANYED